MHYQFYINKAGEVDFDTKLLEPKRPFVESVYRAPGKKYHWNGNALVDWDEDTGEIHDAEFEENYGPGSTAERPKTLPFNNVVKIDHEGKPVKGGGIVVSHPHGKAKDIYKTLPAYAAAHGDGNCVLCGCDLKDEFDDALVIDPETVACGSCHTFCEVQEPKVNLV
jgi:hypothetical protein